VRVEAKARKPGLVNSFESGLRCPPQAQAPQSEELPVQCLDLNLPLDPTTFFSPATDLLRLRGRVSPAR